MGTSHLQDPSFPVVDDVGFDQGYLTFKFPDAFGNRGGIALMAGIFSERFGTSGPYQKSSGYYSTYLFGRTHQAGTSVTFNVDVTDKLELVLETGAGAKTEVVPFFANSSTFQQANLPSTDEGPLESDLFPGSSRSPTDRPSSTTTTAPSSSKTTYASRGTTCPRGHPTTTRTSWAARSRRRA